MLARLLFCSVLVFAAQPAIADDVSISYGPILGRLSSDGVGVSARTSRAGEFAVRYGRTAETLDRQTPVMVTVVDHDYANWIHVTGLQPNTRYFYQVFVPGGAEKNQTKITDKTRAGTFRTLPDPKQYRDPQLNPKGLFNFRFEFACGNNQTPGQGGGSELPAFKTMLRTLPDEIYFSLLNGDWLYEMDREYSVQQWLRQVGKTADEEPDIVKIAPSIVGVWENYKAYLRKGKPLAAYHRNMPTFFTFDDHEILNDVWGCGTPGLRDRRAVFRDIGVQAWYDYLGWSNPTPFTQRIKFGRADWKKKATC